MPLLTLVSAILLFGIAESMVNSYIILFGADVAGMSPLQLGVWTSAFAVGGITISWTLGRMFDRRPSRTYAIAVIVLGAGGYVVLPQVTSFPLLLLMAATVFASLSAAFPQLFALGRAVLGEGRSTPFLRASWSMAWAVGPLIGALVLARGGYPWLMWTAAGAYLIAALTVLLVPRPGPAPVAATTTSTAGATPVLLTASVTLFFTAMFAGGIALALFVTRGLNQPAESMGVLFSVCAAVEVVATLALAVLPARTSQLALILVGFGSFAAYHYLTVAATGMPLLIAGQALRGIAIAIVATAGIRYFQDHLAPATGRATTLFANASTTGLLISGILSGVAVEQFGYRTTLVLCGTAALIGGVLFALGARRKTETLSHA
ncbi:MFS transporter [Actinoplanes sp. NPDC026670]|uniref:MFS transporter n=1 Tax=Actinoplanes sp. NPDC026670 TaxID=3154700 RepID=UPI0033D9874D